MGGRQLGLELLKADCGLHLGGLQGRSGPKPGSLSVPSRCPGARRLVFTKQLQGADAGRGHSHLLKCADSLPHPRKSPANSGSEGWKVEQVSEQVILRPAS